MSSPVIGLIGAPLLIAAVFATLFGQHSSLTGLAALPAIPVAAWELSLGVWLVIKGFKPSALTTEMAATVTHWNSGQPDLAGEDFAQLAADGRIGLLVSFDGAPQPPS